MCCTHTFSLLQQKYSECITYCKHMKKLQIVRGMSIKIPSTCVVVTEQMFIELDWYPSTVLSLIQERDKSSTSKAHS